MYTVFEFRTNDQGVMTDKEKQNEIWINAFLR